VEEGLFISDEPAEVLDQQLELPNQDGALSKDVEQALIEKLAEQLGIDPRYISISGSVEGASRQRALSGGLALKITILSDDSGALAAALAALVSDPSFWQGVNNRLVENNVPTTLDTSGIISFINVTCNENFERDSDTGSCIAVPISCRVGTFAAAGTGQCVDCPAGKYSDEAGASACKNCAPGRFGKSNGSSLCTFCPGGYYRSNGGNNEGGLENMCQQCPWGKYQNSNGSAYCEEVWSNHLLVMAISIGYQQRQCPRLGVSCTNNTKQYAGTHWHDPNVASPNCTVASTIAGSSSYEDLKCTKMYTCINQGCPDAGAPLMQCKPEYHGPLCAICKEGHFEQLGSCVKCEGPQLGASMAFFISMLLLVVCGRLLYRYRTVVHAMNVGANLKIIVSFLTVISTINKQFGVTWPVINHSTRNSTI
jgi:hypothetical protein